MSEWTKERHDAAVAREKAARPLIYSGRGRVETPEAEYVADFGTSNNALQTLARLSDIPDMLAKIEALTAQLGKLREATSTLCDAVCNLDHYEADDPEGPDLMQALGAAQDACASSPAPAA